MNLPARGARGVHHRITIEELSAYPAPKAVKQVHWERSWKGWSTPGATFQIPRQGSGHHTRPGTESQGEKRCGMKATRGKLGQNSLNLAPPPNSGRRRLTRSPVQVFWAISLSLFLSGSVPKDPGKFRKWTFSGILVISVHTYMFTDEY